MKTRWKTVLPKHWYSGFPLPGSPEKRSQHPDDRPSYPFCAVTGGYRRVVAHGDPHGTAVPYSTKRNNHEGN